MSFVLQRKAAPMWTKNEDKKTKREVVQRGRSLPKIGRQSRLLLLRLLDLSRRLQASSLHVHVWVVGGAGHRRIHRHRHRGTVAHHHAWRETFEKRPISPQKRDETFLQKSDTNQVQSVLRDRPSWRVCQSWVLLIVAWAVSWERLRRRLLPQGTSD